MITTTAGDTVSGVDVVLTRTNTISGRVTNAAGRPLSDIDIDVYLVGGSGFPVETLTDPDGRFLYDLPDGDYLVRAAPHGSSHPSLGDLAPRYYGNTDGSNRIGAVISLRGNVFRE